MFQMMGVFAEFERDVRAIAGAGHGTAIHASTLVSELNDH
jgi:hypothetical protein